MKHDETQNFDSVDPLDDILAAVLLAQSSGQLVDRDQLLREHPEHADEIASFLDDYRQLDRQFEPLRQVASSISRIQAEAATIGREDTIAPTPQAGSTFGGYELLNEIARGGMGVVYKARQRSLNRIVALKMVLGGRRNDSTDRDRFLAEAKAVARLSHPHIVPIYEVGEHDGQPYFTMQFVSGGSLRERLEEFRSDQRSIAQLVATVARALEHAHRRGILHRDLKPSNVLLDDKRQPHITDFGLAKQLDDDSNLTQAGAVVGTPSYMSPEQAGGQTDLCTAVDVWGLGAVLYELLTGRPPFKGETPMETVLQVLQQEPKRPSQFESSVDPDLETITLKCLEKDPSRRYGSSEALADDLDRWLTGQPIQARPVTRTERLLKWSRRQPLAAGSLAMTFAVALGLMIASGFLWRNAELRAQVVQDLGQAKGELAQAVKDQKKAESLVAEQSRLADEQRKIADEQKQLAGKVKDEVARLQKNAEAEMAKANRARTAADHAVDELEYARHAARRTLYAADMQLASAAWQSDNIALVKELVERYRDPKNEFDLRGFEWDYFARRLNVARRSWSVGLPLGSALIGLAVSPDGKQVATASNTGAVKLWNIADGQLVRSFNAGNFKLVSVFFSADGQKLTAVTRKSDYDFAKLNQTILPAMEKKESFSLKYLTGDMQLLTWSLVDKSGLRERFDPMQLGGPLMPALSSGIITQHGGEAIVALTINRSHNSQFLAIGGAAVSLQAANATAPDFLGGRLLLWDVVKGEVANYKKFSSTVVAAAFSHDNQSLAVSYSDGGIDLFPIDLAKEPRRLGAHRGYVHSLCFSGDDQQLVSGSVDATVAIWNVAEGKQTCRFMGHSQSVMRAEFTPDGESIVSADFGGEVKVWNVHFTGEPLVLHGHNRGAVLSMTFNADSHELTSADVHGDLKCWRMNDGSLARETLIAGTYSGLVFSRDGKFLVAKDAVNDKFFVRDLVSGKDVQLSWPGRTPVGLAISADGKYVSASAIPEGELAVWQASDGKLLAKLEKIPLFVHPRSFSPDGKTLAANSNGLLLWNWETGDTRRLFDDKSIPIGAAAFSADGNLLAASQAGTVRVWDLQTNQLRSECRGAGTSVTAIAFTPDGRRLITAGSAAQQALLKLWDIDTGRETFTAPTLSGLVSSLAVSADGHRIAAAVITSDSFSVLGNLPNPCDIHVWDASPEK